MAASTIVPRSVPWSNGTSYSTTAAARARVNQYHRGCGNFLIHRWLVSTIGTVLIAYLTDRPFCGTFEMMKTTTFTYTNPRELDGSPFDATRGAGEQLQELLRLAKLAAADMYVLARVAELQRQQDRGEEPSAVDFENGILGTSVAVVEDELDGLGRRVERLTKAVSYNPQEV